jgi:hypothetical protein
MSKKSKILNSTFNHVVSYKSMEKFVIQKFNNSVHKIHKILKLKEMVMTFYKATIDPYIKQPRVYIRILQLHQSPKIITREYG